MATPPPSLYRRTVERAAHRMQQAIASAAANIEQLQLADKLAARLCAGGMQATADCDEQAQPFLVLMLPIEQLGHHDAEDMLQLAASTLRMAIDFNHERGAHFINCGHPMAQGMPLLMQEI